MFDLFLYYDSAYTNQRNKIVHLIILFFSNKVKLLEKKKSLKFTTLSADDDYPNENSDDSDDDRDREELEALRKLLERKKRERLRRNRKMRRKLLSRKTPKPYRSTTPVSIMVCQLTPFDEVKKRDLLDTFSYWGITGMETFEKDI